MREGKDSLAQVLRAVNRQMNESPFSSASFGKSRSRSLTPRGQIFHERLLATGDSTLAGPYSDAGNVSSGPLACLGLNGAAKAGHFPLQHSEGKMPLRQAQGRLSRQPAGPFDKLRAGSRRYFVFRQPLSRGN